MHRFGWLVAIGWPSGWNGRNDGCPPPPPLPAQHWPHRCHHCTCLQTGTLWKGLRYPQPARTLHTFPVTASGPRRGDRAAAGLAAGAVCAVCGVPRGTQLWPPTPQWQPAFWMRRTGVPGGCGLLPAVVPVRGLFDGVDTGDMAATSVEKAYRRLGLNSGPGIQDGVGLSRRVEQDSRRLPLRPSGRCSVGRGEYAWGLSERNAASEPRFQRRASCAWEEVAGTTKGSCEAVWSVECGAEREGGARVRRATPVHTASVAQGKPLHVPKVHNMCCVRRAVLNSQQYKELRHALH